MFSVTEKNNSINFIFSSDMRHIDRIIRLCREYIEKFDISKFSEFRLVLREILINAVEHGNKNDIRKTVKCNIEYLGNWRFKMEVQDEGPGFDYQSIAVKIPDDPGQIRNRGFALIHNFSDSMEFSGEGNSITVYISISRETAFHISENEGWQVITPSGDITAGVADNLRTILVEMADKGHRRYRFDFVHVEDIDSIGLSLLIIFAKMLDKQHGEKWLEILNAGRSLSHLLHMTRVDKIYRLNAVERK